MTNIGSTCTYQSSNWAFVSRHFHSKNRTQEPKTETSDSSPSERQKAWFIPICKVVPAPFTATKYQMLFRNYRNVNYSPIADNAQKGLKSIMVVLSSKAANNQSHDKPKSYEDDSRNSYSPRSQVLSMQSEGIVVWNVVLSCIS